MNPVLIIGAVGAVGWMMKRAAERKAQALRATVAGDSEGTVVDLGTSSLPSNDVPLAERTANPTDTSKTFVISRLLAILSPRDGEEVDRPGLFGKTYPVTVQWTNSLAMEWRGSLTAQVAEGDEPPRTLELGEWVIPGGTTRSAVVSLGFGGGRVNFGRTLVQLRLEFSGRSSVASFYVD